MSTPTINPDTVGITGHALDRYRIHHPEASVDDIREALRTAVDVPEEVARPMVGRPTLSKYDRSTYRLPADHRGLFVFTDTGTMVTYLRFQPSQKTFADQAYAKKEESGLKTAVLWGLPQSDLEVVEKLTQDLYQYGILVVEHQPPRSTADWRIPMGVDLALIITDSMFGPQAEAAVKVAQGARLHYLRLRRRIAVNRQILESNGFIFRVAQKLPPTSDQKIAAADLPPVKIDVPPAPPSTPPVPAPAPPAPVSKPRKLTLPFSLTDFMAAPDRGKGLLRDSFSLLPTGETYTAMDFWHGMTPDSPYAHGNAPSPGFNRLLRALTELAVEKALIVGPRTGQSGKTYAIATSPPTTSPPTTSPPDPETPTMSTVPALATSPQTTPSVQDLLRDLKTLLERLNVQSAERTPTGQWKIRRVVVTEETL